MPGADSSVNPRSKSDLLLIPETVLRKRHDLDDLRRRRDANRKPVKKKGVYIKKPETFLARGRQRRNHTTRYLRVLKKGMQKRASDDKTIYTKQVGDEEISFQSNSVGASMVFCIRICDDTGLPTRVKRLLQELRLKKIHAGVFIRYTPKNRTKLHLLEPFVVYGPPTEAVIQDLLTRRGHAWINEERVPLSDNVMVEKALGKHNILCIEDLVHELTSAGDLFGVASKFLCPFSLEDAKTYFERQTLKVKNGKEYGDQGENINDYIQQVL